MVHLLKRLLLFRQMKSIFNRYLKFSHREPPKPALLSLLLYISYNVFFFNNTAALNLNSFCNLNVFCNSHQLFTDQFLGRIFFQNFLEVKKRDAIHLKAIKPISTWRLPHVGSFLLSKRESKFRFELNLARMISTKWERYLDIERTPVLLFFAQSN